MPKQRTYSKEEVLAIHRAILKLDRYKEDAIQGPFQFCFTLTDIKREALPEYYEFISQYPEFFSEKSRKLITYLLRVFPPGKESKLEKAVQE